MKVKLVTLLLLVLVAVPILAKPPAEVSTRKAPRTAASLDYSHYIDVNNILMFVTNDGQFGRDLSGVFGYDFGTFFPYNGIQYIIDGSGKASPLYASGLWVGGTDSASGEIRVKVAEYNSEYCPGPVDVANGTFYTDRPEFKLYHLYSDSLASNPNEDYTNWIVAARQGAPFVGQYTLTPDSATPVMLGDQMTWAVFNDLNLDNQNDAGHTNALGVEIRQTTFAFKREGPLNNIIFVKFQAYNRTDRVIKNAYFSLWADPDLGGSSDDLVGCDTTLSLGFIYNANNNDQEYHSKPPCLGYDFFQGPLVSTGNPDDTGKAWGQKWPGYKNLGMSSFNKYINGTDPSDFHETYNYMQGLQADGSPLSNGTTYQVPGDPVTGLGDLDIAPADRRFMQSTGPITFRPGDSTEILAAIIVGQGGDRISSISVMKFYDVTAQDAYNNDFQVPAAPAAPVVSIANLEDKVVLRWTDTSEVDHGDYPFQGYTVYQGPASSGPWTQIANFDIVDGTSNILDLVLDPNTGILETRGVKVASDNGLQRYFNVTTDKLTGGKINALTRYYFRVEAYSFDGSKLPKTLTSATNLSTVPEAPLAGETYSKPYGDTLHATHVGSSDGSVQVTVLDPKALVDATYRVVFGVDSILGSVWHLVRTQGTATDTLLMNQVNQSGDTDYRTVDGLLIKVLGPALNFKNFETVANALGPLDPPEGASATFQGFPGPGDPTARQQSNGQRWFIHTGDNGTRGTYASFLSRTVRDGLFWPLIIPHDYEIRFTAGTNWGVDFNTDSIPFPLPFELWDIGIATPNDASDDYRLIASIVENDANITFDLSAYDAADHSASGGNNDPYTDWIYWYRPSDRTPGHAGYDDFVTHLLAGDWAVVDDAEQFMSRMVFVGWNLGVTPPFTPDMPETGTIFRITSTKPNAVTDTFTFATAAPTFAKSEAGLDAINTVPNPYYLFGPFDPTPGNRTIKFQHLPGTCSIRIYNLGGDLVRTLQKDDASSSTLEWDVLTDNLLPLASGIYIWVVEAPGYGTKTGKMAIFNQTEVLQKY